jgi:hypothetical protein
MSQQKRMRSSSTQSSNQEAPEITLHGGARTNAGRRKNPDTGKSVRLPESVLQLLKDLGIRKQFGTEVPGELLKRMLIQAGYIESVLGRFL